MRLAFPLSVFLSHKANIFLNDSFFMNNLLVYPILWLFGNYIMNRYIENALYINKRAHINDDHI
jgi:hypothetical protein